MVEKFQVEDLMQVWDDHQQLFELQHILLNDKHVGEDGGMECEMGEFPEGQLMDVLVGNKKI